TPQVGFTRLAAFNLAKLGQARVSVQSINLRKDLLAKKIDARVKPAHEPVEKPRKPCGVSELGTPRHSSQQLHSRLVAPAVRGNTTRNRALAASHAVPLQVAPARFLTIFQQLNPRRGGSGREHFAPAK